jgi:hypothetical protein
VRRDFLFSQDFFSFLLPFLQKQKANILMLSDLDLKDIIKNRTKNETDNNNWTGFDLMNTSELDEFSPVIYIRSFGSERETQGPKHY